MTRFTIIVAFALALVTGCNRAAVSDAVSSPADDSNTQPARVASDSDASAGPTRLLPPSGSLDDGVISARIRASLALDPAMDGSDISVNTDHGIVSLTGFVSSREQAAVASSHAQAQDGVMRVDDHLTVDLR